VALDWPGWCRSGKTEEEALENLRAYTSRYAAVAARSAVPVPGATDFDVVGTIEGDSGTAYGVPSRLGPGDRDAPLDQVREAQLALLQACWNQLDETAAASPPILRKGPRGGGRDRDKMLEHVIGAEVMYARYVGLREPEVAWEAQALVSHRAALVTALRQTGNQTVGEDGRRRWPFAYAVRRIAWHVLDHAWEMEDRRDP
jgi:hypothetical protein